MPLYQWRFFRPHAAFPRLYFRRSRPDAPHTNRLEHNCCEDIIAALRGQWKFPCVSSFSTMAPGIAQASGKTEAQTSDRKANLARFPRSGRGSGNNELKLPLRSRKWLCCREKFHFGPCEIRIRSGLPPIAGLAAQSSCEICGACCACNRCGGRAKGCAWKPWLA